MKIILCKNISWLGNPVVWASSQLTWNPWTFAICVFAFVPCACFLFNKNVLVNGGNKWRLFIEYRIGYWLWLSGATTMLAANVLALSFK